MAYTQTYIMETWVRPGRQWRLAAAEHQRDIEQRLESYRQQTAELATSLQRTQQELQATAAEAKRLSDREASWEGSQQVDRQTTTAGKPQSKQAGFIKLLETTKKERDEIRDEFNKERQIRKKLEVQLRKVTSLDPSLADAACDPTTPDHRRHLHGGPATPGPPARCPPESSDGAALRKSRANARAAERASNNMTHILALVEQAFDLEPSSAPDAGEAAWARQRLRELTGGLHARRATADEAIK